MAPHIDLFVDLLIALSIGAMLGIEREIAHQKSEVRDFGGIRTFILIALLGYLLTYGAVHMLNSPAAFFLGFAMFMLLLTASYVLIALKTGKYGLTTEIAAIIVFLLASALAWDTKQTLNLGTVIIAVIVAALLAVKQYLHRFAKKIEMPELYAAIKLAIITLVILPLLPNKDYAPVDIPGIAPLVQFIPSLARLATELTVLNPFKIWLMVAFISSVSFVGYILIKTLGSNKGIRMTSFFGGLVSSTAVTIALAAKSNERAGNVPLAIGIVIASTVMFGRVLLEVLVVNPDLALSLFVPLIAMVGTGIIATRMIAHRQKSLREEKLDLKSPFALGPALKFGVLFAGILIIARAFHILFGTSGLYIASLLAGLADVDAITISLATLARSESLDSAAATLGITLALAANMLVKAGIVYVSGARSLAKTVFYAFVAMIAVGALAALLL